MPAGTTSVATDTYTYDAADQLTKIKVSAAATTFTHDAADELTTATNAVGTTSYTNDPRGNRAKMVDAVGNTTSYGYDQANRLTSFTGPPLSALNSVGAATVSATYTYNGDGLRVGKQLTVNGVGVNLPETWDLTGSVPLMLTDGTNDYIYGVNGLPIEQVSAAGSVTWLHSDRQGSVRALSNSVGVVTGSTNYDPYGQTISTTGTVTSPLEYDGQYTDSESGLVYLRARFYDPSSGVFLSRDPLEATTRVPYQYAADSPPNASDPSGRDTLGFCGGAAGSFLGPAGYAEGCLTRTVDEQSDQIGVTGTLGGGGGGGLGAFAGGYVQISNATNLSDLGGAFAYYNLNVGDEYGGSLVLFIGKNSAGRTIYGLEIGGGVTANFSGLIPGAPFTTSAGVSKTWVHKFSYFWTKYPAMAAWDVANSSFGVVTPSEMLHFAHMLACELGL